MEYGLLLLRVVVGVIFVAHGSQKLFGWFGGYGPQGTGQFFGSIGYRWPVVLAVLVGLTEFGGGLLLALGFLTPLACLGIAVVMLNAIATVAFPKGFIGGWEFEFTLLTVAIALAATGPGEISIDDAIGWADNISGVAWASVVLASAIVITLVTTTIGRARTDLDDIPT
jgi:putative oxidoreductase